MACRDITYDTLKFIDEHALVLQNNLHKQFCPQALCYNLHVTTSPVSTIQNHEIWATEKKFATAPITFFRIHILSQMS